MNDAKEFAESMPGVLDLAGIIHDAADGGTSEEYCSWTMANRAAEAIHARMQTVKGGMSISKMDITREPRTGAGSLD